MRKLDFSPDPFPRCTKISMAYQISDMSLRIWLDEVQYRVDVSALEHHARQALPSWISGSTEANLEEQARYLWKHGMMRLVE